jgi:hypothetical protein
MKDVHRKVVVALAILATGWLASCDCLFNMEGRVVECGTTIPVSDVPIAIRIDRGHRDRQRDATEGPYATNQDGRFRVVVNDPCRSWVTLTFQKEGYETLQMQYKGAPEDSVSLCMNRAASP